MNTTRRSLSLGSALLCAALLAPATGCAVLVGSAVAGGAAGTAASVEESKSGDHSAMTYAGSVLGSVLYLPAKVLFALGGGLTSGATYLVTLGDDEPSGRIWKASVEGDYVLTPRMVDGDDPVRFVGTSETSRDDGDS